MVWPAQCPCLVSNVFNRSCRPSATRHPPLPTADDLLSVKNEKKIAKRKAQQEKFAAYANMNTKKISSTANSSSSSSSSTNDNRTQYEKRRSDIAKKAGSVSTKDSPTTSSSGGGMMAKANAVKNFNEKNNN